MDTCLPIVYFKINLCLVFCDSKYFERIDFLRTNIIHLLSPLKSMSSVSMRTETSAHAADKARFLGISKSQSKW